MRDIMRQRFARFDQHLQAFSHRVKITRHFRQLIVPLTHTGKQAD
ncbi:hypothetical protein SRABI106_03701 [Rahnella aquatilis]|nr:hypothetical protein SRABI106_03701 [Rahnella aquatilis]